MAPRPGGPWSALARRTGVAVALLAIGLVAGATLFPDSRHDLAPMAVAAPHRVDIGFSQDMIVHHQQAVDMSRMVRGRVSPPIAAIADAVATNQLREIGQMQGWLALWNAPQLTSGEPMAWMAAGDPAMHHRRDAGPGSGDARMPGMASVAELQQLGVLSGTALDACYLQLMIRHHRGGIEIAAAAVKSAETVQVRSFADNVVIDQQRESDSMTALLTGMGKQPLPFP
ncbi:DUF305 domain-containing protein [Pseudonocardia sp. GCM10023141]|uniref:DUF305 domain-containing protein n=1 Tax=Pseudonocardia sp. GCM10023141 TaxID=3252653 RepID=UPI00361CE9CB